MAFWDEILLGRGGGLVGTAGNAASLAADFIDDSTEEGKKSAGNAAMTAGGLGIISGLMGGGKSIKDYFDAKGGTTDKDKNRRKGAVAGGISGLAGIVGGIADMIGGSAKKSGNSSLETGMSWVSNIAGLVGTGAGLAQNSYDLKNANIDLEKAKDSGNEDDLKAAKAARTSAISGLTTGALGGLGGILGLVGNSMDAAGKSGSGWSKAGSVIGNGLGGLSSLIGVFL